MHGLRFILMLKALCLHMYYRSLEVIVSKKGINLSFGMELVYY